MNRKQAELQSRYDSKQEVINAFEQEGYEAVEEHGAVWAHKRDTGGAVAQALPSATAQPGESGAWEVDFLHFS